MWNKRLAVVLLLWLGVAGASHAQGLGRLFTTPAERAALNRERTALFEEQSLQELIVPDEPVVEQEPPQELGIVQLTGIVRRADGAHTVWLNGVPVEESALPDHVQLTYQNGTAVVLIRVLDQVHALKPGQSLDATLGAVRESYEVTPEQAQAINAEVAARAERLRLQAQQRASRAAAAGAPEEEQAPISEDDAMVQSVVEGLRILQELQSLQNAQGGQP